ncbi:MAG: transposase, partial [Rhizobiaceae bacterium]|nr:transposase [Rhizobiaceae bacterium]
SDYKGFDIIYDADTLGAKVLIADKGYNSNHIRDTVAQSGGTAAIPSRSKRKNPDPIVGYIYALRNQVERCFNKLKCSRRLATRYDKTAASYLSFIHIASTRIWFRSLST